MTVIALIVIAIPPASLLGVAALVIHDLLRERAMQREGVELAEWAQAWNDLYAAPARQPRSHV